MPFLPLAQLPKPSLDPHSLGSTSLIIGDRHKPEGVTVWSLPGNPKEDILTICEGGFGQTFQLAERSSAGERQWTQSNIRFSGAMSIDATRPFIYKDAFERARYNVEVIDLAKFYSLEQIAKVKAGPRDYAKFLADRRI